MSNYRVRLILKPSFIVLMPDRHLLFYSQNIYFIGVHELIPLCGIRFLDEKSKQKNQEKIIPAFTH